MKRYLIPVLILFSLNVFSQVPDDALRNAWFVPGGSARNMAIGGVMGSLGGDITAANVNPAGIGFYNTKEIVFSPGYVQHNNSADFRDGNTRQNTNGFILGPVGYIGGGNASRINNAVSNSFSVSINQLTSFSNHISYSGFNNQTSFSEQYLEELTRDGANFDAASNNYIFGSSLAYRTYLIDSINDASGAQTGYRSLVPVGSGIFQQKDEVTKGGLYEISVAFASNNANKLYLGGSLNIPVVSFKRDIYYKETDALGVADNDFNFFEYRENFKSTGVGINAKLGLIYRPQPYIRLGFAVHTPSLLTMNDDISASMTTDTEGYAGLVTESSDNLNSGNPGNRQYNEITPWKAIASASYVFREVADTKKQRAFISADIEYVNYRGSRFSALGEIADPVLDAYYKELNSTIKDYYKGNINLKLGGELKFDPWMFRAGIAYFGSPYSDQQLKANITQLSGGLGYRNNGMFIDITYAYSINKDVNFPYRLNDKPNTFAELNNKKGNILTTIGFKL